MKNMCFSLDVCKKYLQNMEVPRFGRNLGREVLSKEILTVGLGLAAEGGGAFALIIIASERSRSICAYYSSV